MAQSSPTPSQLRLCGASCLKSAEPFRSDSIKRNSGTSGNIVKN